MSKGDRPCSTAACCSSFSVAVEVVDVDVAEFGTGRGLLVCIRVQLVFENFFELLTLGRTTAMQ